jgi:hypothetical protein
MPKPNCLSERSGSQHFDRNLHFPMVFIMKSLIFDTMTQGQKATVCLVVAALGVSTTVGANTADPGSNPYQSIVGKNVFRLKPPPPPPSEEPVKVPTPKITLTGITTFGKKRAMVKTPPPPAKPGEQPKGEQFFMLAEGERDGDMEMVAIDEVAGSVKVKYAGTEVALNFVDNGAKPTNVPAMPVPGQPGAQPGGFIPQPPTGLPGVQPSMQGAKPLPTRTLRLPTPTGGATGYNPAGAYPGTVGSYVPPAAANSFQVTTPGGGMQTLPSFQMSNPGGAAGAPPAAPTTQQEQLTAEQQMVIMEIQKQQNLNNPAFPPLPPTPINPTPTIQPPIPTQGGIPRPQ